MNKIPKGDQLTDWIQYENLKPQIHGEYEIKIKTTLFGEQTLRATWEHRNGSLGFWTLSQTPTGMRHVLYSEAIVVAWRGRALKPRLAIREEKQLPLLFRRPTTHGEQHGSV